MAGRIRPHMWIRPDVSGVYVKSRIGRTETNFYSSTLFQVVKSVGAVFADRVKYLHGHRKRKSHRFARAAEFERLQHGLEFWFRAGLQLGERHEPADHVTQIRGGLFVARLGSDDAADAAVDVTAHREP